MTALTAEQTARIIDLRRRGATMVGIARTCNVSLPTVRKLLDRHGRQTDLAEEAPDGPPVGALVAVVRVNERRQVIAVGVLVRREAFGCAVKCEGDGRVRGFNLLEHRLLVR